MTRPTLTRRQELDRAYRRVCRQCCERCGRRCQTKHVYGHIFDCCGIRVGHILRSTDLEPIRVYRGSAYLVGQTRTAPGTRGKRVVW